MNDPSRPRSSNPILFLWSGLLLLALAGCKPLATPTLAPAWNDQPSTPTTSHEPATQEFTNLASISINAPVTASTPLTSLDPFVPQASTPAEGLSYRYWRWWPVNPSVSHTTYRIYQRGIKLGANRNAFSIIGDCQAMPAIFGGRYDHPGQYYLPEGYEYLQETIDRFTGSFDRPSVTIQNGFSVTAAFSPLWTDPDLCQSGETPLACELRIHRPSFVFIALGTNWNSDTADRHTEILEQIVDQVIAAGAVPILSTKGDNQEGNHSINLGVAELAAVRDLPLWNYWRAIQELPNHGLDAQRDSNY